MSLLDSIAGFVAGLLGRGAKAAGNELGDAAEKAGREAVKGTISLGKETAVEIVKEVKGKPKKKKKKTRKK